MPDDLQEAEDEFLKRLEEEHLEEPSEENKSTNNLIPAVIAAVL